MAAVSRKELKEIQDQYLHMRQEHKSLITNFGLKEAQTKSLQEELSEVLEDQQKVKGELLGLRTMESKLRKENQEYSEKIAKMNSEQYVLLKEIDTLNRANDTLAGHSNGEQKIRHLNKLKEENSRLKTEKMKLNDDYTKQQELLQKLQKVGHLSL